jgi:poly(3-hydroxybutyrate) depolymerase
MGYPGVRDLSQVNPTAGCGKMADIQPGTWVARTTTMIAPPPGQSGNPGTGTRKYFVRIPPNYDNNKKYKVVIAASSCTGGDQSNRSQPTVPGVTDRAGGAVLIAPVVEPGVWDRDQCYDDKDPNSIEFPFLDRFLAEVGDKYCFDKNKVLVEGHSSGGWYSNMLGFARGSDTIRAISSNGGGIPDDSSERPKFTDRPLPGLWIFPTGDTEQPLSAKRAVSRALVVNKCMGAGTNPADETAWMKAPNMPWAEGGAQGCRKYMCPDAFPVIFCTPQGQHAEVSWHASAAWAMFDKLP